MRILNYEGKKMNLTDLKDSSFSKLNNTLKEVFGIQLDFNKDVSKLKAIKESTIAQIENLRDNGIDQSNRDFQKLLLIKEGLDHAIETKEDIMETQDLDQAEVLLAAKQMADDLQKMAENLASMQVEELMSITNAMKDEVGTAEADAFNAAAEAAIAGALEAVKGANEAVNNAVLAAQGQNVETDMDMDMAEPEMGSDEIEMEPEMGDMEDDFEGADAAEDMSDEGGREMKEDSYLAALRMIKEAQSEGQVSKEILKKAFAQLK